MSWNSYVNSNYHPVGRLNSMINSTPSGNSDTREVYRKQEWHRKSGIIPGSILDKTYD